MNWKKIRTDYENGGISYRKIAEKYGVTIGAVRYRAGKEGWLKKETHQREKTADTRNTCYTEPEDNEDNSDEKSRKRELIVSVADKLLECVSRAADELDCYVIKNKVKTKTVEYNNESGKADCETVCEDEHIEPANCIVDRSELRQLVTALKDIKDIYENVSESDNRIEDLIRGLCDGNEDIQQ